MASVVDQTKAQGFTGSACDSLKLATVGIRLRVVHAMVGSEVYSFHVNAVKSSLSIDQDRLCCISPGEIVSPSEGLGDEIQVAEVIPILDEHDVLAVIRGFIKR